MKIYIIPCNAIFQPDEAIFYPAHSCGDEVEQDFTRFLSKNGGIITQNHAEADWHYLPIYWTRWHVKHDYGKSRLTELQEEIDRRIIDDGKTFTICQYDDGPLVNLGNTKVFLSSRKSDEGVDIPLLCSPHKKPFFRPSKKYLASFVGRLFTHPMRNEMSKELCKRKDVYIFDGHKSTKYFIKKALSSYIALCPRGYGGSSFRFFEAMQLGVPPLLLGDIDTRPFKKWIDWDQISFYVSSAKEINDTLDAFSADKLLEMGRQANKVYEEQITFQKWCPYVIRELEALM